MMKIISTDPDAEFWDQLEKRIAFTDYIHGTMREEGWTLYKGHELSKLWAELRNVPGWQMAIQHWDHSDHLNRLALSAGVEIVVGMTCNRSGYPDKIRAHYQGQGEIEFEGIRYTCTAKPAGPRNSSCWGNPPHWTNPLPLIDMMVSGWIKFTPIK
tara:strand:- start:227 stop:694 length:468 start_codon:yes stop_codon:yes gene_type:complete